MSSITMRSDPGSCDEDDYDEDEDTTGHDASRRLSWLYHIHLHSDVDRDWMNDEEKELLKKERKASVLKLYKNGTRLFTKQMLQDIASQLKTFKPAVEDQTITVTGIDGNKTPFPIGTDLVDRSVHHNWKRGKLYLDYLTLNDIVNTRPRKNTDDMYSIVILQQIHPHDKATDERLGIEPIDSVETTLAKFEAVQQEWEASDACKRLRTIFDSLPNLPRITKIVAFACNSIASAKQDELGERGRRRSMTQHALILTLRDMFCDKLSYDSSQEKTIKCYAQDPIYNDSDIGALASLDITVLDDPDGFLQLDEETAVISIAPNICVKQVVTELSRPALIFWNLTEKGKTEEEMLEMKLTDPPSSRVVQMLEHEYDIMQFCEDIENFGTVEICMRKIYLD